MVNKYSETVSDAIGNIERLIAIVENLKLLTQDGFDSILDDNQKREVQDILDDLTRFQKADFKLIQVFEDRDKKMDAIEKRLYSILPSDVLKSIFGEKNDFGDLPEDLISEIVGDEKNNSVNDSSVDDSKNDDEASKEGSLMNQIMDLSSTTSSSSANEEASSNADEASETAPAVQETVKEDAAPEVAKEVSEIALPVQETVKEDAAPEVAKEVSEIALPVQETVKEDAAPEVAKEVSEIALPVQETVKEDAAPEVAKEVSEIALPVQETVKENAAPEVAKEVSEIALPVQETVKENAAPEVAKEVSETAPTLQVPAKENVEVNITGNDLEGNIVLPVLQQELNEEKPVIASLDTTPVQDAYLTVVSRGNSKPLVVTSTQLSNLKESLPPQLEKISPFLNLSSQESHSSSLEEMVKDTDDLSGLVVDETNLERVVQLMQDANREGNYEKAEKISDLIFAYNNSNKSNQKTLTLSNAA